MESKKPEEEVESAPGERRRERRSRSRRHRDSSGAPAAGSRRYVGPPTSSQPSAGAANEEQSNRDEESEVVGIRRQGQKSRHDRRSSTKGSEKPEEDDDKRGSTERGRRSRQRRSRREGEQEADEGREKDEQEAPATPSKGDEDTPELKDGEPKETKRTEPRSRRGRRREKHRESAESSATQRSQTPRGGRRGRRRQKDKGEAEEGPLDRQADADYVENEDEGEFEEEDHIAQEVTAYMPLPPSVMDVVFGSGYLLTDKPRLPKFYVDMGDSRRSDIDRQLQENIDEYGALPDARSRRAAKERERQHLQHGTFHHVWVKISSWFRTLLLGHGIDAYAPLPQGVIASRLIKLLIGITVLFVLTSLEVLCLFDNFCFERSSATVSVLASRVVFPGSAVILIILVPLNAVAASIYRRGMIGVMFFIDAIATILLIVGSIIALSDSRGEQVEYVASARCESEFCLLMSSLLLF
eukprot:gb/GECG01013804.1/.p1 GENE.gb/GECG01013804.1/~~gb/GECG01013804.1/.p1  ORF type:complete len:469 (+),score=73.78 gb/GECG01013804.1/:1-1407(+)